MDGTAAEDSLPPVAHEANGNSHTNMMETVPVDDNGPHATSTTASRRRAPPSRQVSNISMPKSKAGIFGTSANLVNSIVGAGIIGIPYAIANAGFIVGILLLILVGYMTDKSLRMIVETAMFHPKLRGLGVLTFEDLMSIPFGRFGSMFILINMFVMAYGAMVAYLLIIKDTVPVVLGIGGEEAGKGTFWERELIMILTSLAIVVPLSMMRDMATLAWTSLLSVLADVILVIFIIIYSPYQDTLAENGGFVEAVLQDNWVNGKLFIGLGVLSTAMACQHSAFIVFGSLANNTSARWAMVTFRSISTATIMCLLLGITGYLGFLQETQGDILNNFETDSKMANAGRALLAITMFFTYPMESFVARHVLANLLYNGDLDNDTVDPNSGAVISPERKFLGCLGRRERLTLYIYLAVLLPALIVDDLGPVLSLTGSLGASCVAYIGPGLVYLGINGDEFLAYTARLLNRSSSSGGLKRSSSTANGGGGGDVELPVVGDATATMQTAPEPTHPYEGGGRCKPWWWFVGLFPIWTGIASNGAIGTRNFLAQLHEQHPQSNGGGGNDVAVTAAAEDGQEIIGPRRRDYYISMFFIFFGVIAAVVGVASNIYVEVHGIFFSPH